jgi:hypothetical protein
MRRGRQHAPGHRGRGLALVDPTVGTGAPGSIVVFREPDGTPFAVGGSLAPGTGSLRGQVHQLAEDGAWLERRDGATPSRLGSAG